MESMSDSEWYLGSRCSEVMGFFVLGPDGRSTSPNFSVQNPVRQIIRVVVLPTGETDVGARLAVVQAGDNPKVVGFTTEKSEAGYYYEGEVLPGVVHLVPVYGHPPAGWTGLGNESYEDWLEMFRTSIDGRLEFSPSVDQALEEIFALLDADSNLFLSATEMSVLKRFLGLERCDLAEDEWSDMLFGWRDGDLNLTLTEMSVDFFKRFILHVCLGRYTFPGDDFCQVSADPRKSILWYTERENRLRWIFRAFGFDGKLRPINVSRYRISIYHPFGWLTVRVLARETLEPEKTVQVATRAFGTKLRNVRSGFALYILRCPDWFSVVVKNTSDEARRLSIDCSGTVGALPLPTKPLLWEATMPEEGEAVSCGVGHLTFH